MLCIRIKTVPTKANIFVIFRGKIDDQEWRFLLTGGVALENPFPNPASVWLSDKSWAEIVRCSELPAFKGFMDQFKEQVNFTQVFHDSSFGFKKSYNIQMYLCPLIMKTSKDK